MDEEIYIENNKQDSSSIKDKKQFQFIWQQSIEKIKNKLEIIQFNELSSRKNTTIQIVCLNNDDNNSIIGFCEIFLWDVQNEQRLQERLIELDENNNYDLSQRMIPKISNLCVSKEYRRLGIAQTLFKRCVQIATERKWPTDMVVLAVDSDNIIARNFYLQKLNFQDVLVDSSLYRYVITTEKLLSVFKRARLDSEKSTKVIMMYLKK